MKYRIIRDVYDRCGGEVKESTFEASSDKLAVALVLTYCMYGVNLTKEQFRDSPIEDLLHAIHYINGDGCDYIYLLKNEDTGSILYSTHECDRELKENWDEEGIEWFDEDEDEE